MSYQGLEMTSQEDYIFSDTIPYNPDFDLEELQVIQTKLENYTSGKSSSGLTSHEAEFFLDWITFNARNYAVKGTPESPITATMHTRCAPTQRINVSLLQRLGLDVRAFNVGDCIDEILLRNLDRERIPSSSFSPTLKHSVSLVNLPIVDDSGYTQSYQFLLDPTFRQFCLKKNCDSNRFSDKNWLASGYVAPHPGYFMESKNLLKLGVSTEVAQQTEALAEYLISKGYFRLNEETAKLYGDTFVRASKRIEFQNEPIYISGNDYIRNFETIPMKMFGNSKDDDKFLKLPKEIANGKQGLFSALKKFFQERFGNKTKMLSSGNTPQAHSDKQPKLAWVELTPEQYIQYEQGTTEILQSHKENQNQHNGQEHSSTEYEIDQQ